MFLLCVPSLSWQIDDFSHQEMEGRKDVSRLAFISFVIVAPKSAPLALPSRREILRVYGVPSSQRNPSPAPIPAPANINYVMPLRFKLGGRPVLSACQQCISDGAGTTVHAKALARVARARTLREPLGGWLGSGAQPALAVHRLALRVH
eukprot:COSAG06_NODE_4888_length_3880_cov_3.336683_4_plen_149_part_00